MKVPLAAVSVSPPKSRQVQSAKKLPNSANKKSRSPVPRPSYTQTFYRNEELEEKTAAIQREYDALLGELLENRQNTNLRGKDDGFYRVMNDYIKEYTGEPGLFNHNMRKHTSPTKRLISMKDTDRFLLLIHTVHLIQIKKDIPTEIHLDWFMMM